MQALNPSGSRRKLLLPLALALAGVLWLLWPGQREFGVQPAAPVPLPVLASNAVAAHLEQDVETERAAIEGSAPVLEPVAGMTAATEAAQTSDWLAPLCSDAVRRSGQPMGGEFRFSGRLLQPNGSPMLAGTKVWAYLSYVRLSPNYGNASQVRPTMLEAGEGGDSEFSLDINSAPARLNACLEFWFDGPGLDTPWSARLSMPDPITGGDFDFGTVRLLPAPILVTGRVVDGQGLPLESISVSVRSANELDEDGRDPWPGSAFSDPGAAWRIGKEVKRLRSARTDAQGGFLLRGELASALFLVGAEHRLGETAVWARPGERELLLRLDLSQALSGVVRLAPGVAPPQQIYVLLSEQLGAKDVEPHHEEDPGTIREALLALPRAELLPEGELRDIKLHFEAQGHSSAATLSNAQALGGRDFVQIGDFPGLVRALLGATEENPQGRLLLTMGYNGSRMLHSTHTWNQNSPWAPAVTEFAFDFGKRDDREYRLELIGICLQGPPGAPKLSYLHKTLWIQYDSSVSEPAWQSELVLK